MQTQGKWLALAVRDKDGDEFHDVDEALFLQTVERQERLAKQRANDDKMIAAVKELDTRNKLFRPNFRKEVKVGDWFHKDSGGFIGRTHTQVIRVLAPNLVVTNRGVLMPEGYDWRVVDTQRFPEYEGTEKYAYEQRWTHDGRHRLEN